MNHKWKDNTCVRCGINREKKRWALLMASVGDKDFYTYGNSYHYGKPHGFNRPECVPDSVKVGSIVNI